MTITTNDLAPLIGATGILETTGRQRLRIAVTVLDAKPAYGRTLLLVVPVAGDQACQAWVEQRQITLDKKK